MSFNRRRKLIWKLDYNIRILNVSIAIVLALILFILFMAQDVLRCLQGSPLMGNFIVILLTFSAITVIFLIVLVVTLHRGIGGIQRMEKILQEILGGKYHLRVHLRKKDLIHSFANTLNKILALLEEKAKK